MHHCPPKDRFGGKPFVDGHDTIERRRHRNIPEMIAADRTFQTRSSAGTSIILTELNRLIDPTVSITEVGRLRISEMNPKTFR